VSRVKLVYVLPTYDANSQEHLYHIYGFLERASQQLDIWLIIERASGQPHFAGLRVYRRRLQVPVLRALEVGAVMLWARLSGYKVFYTHYSISGAVLSALVTRILGGVSYYWSCVHTLDFVPKTPRTWPAWKLKLRNQYLLSLALHWVHHLVTGTQTMARYYSEGYGLELSSVRVMPNWVDLKRFTGLPGKTELRLQLGWPPQNLVVLFLHRIVERKGAQFIVPIVQQVMARSVGLTERLMFVVAGSGPYEETLAREVEAAGLTRVVHLVGGVPNREAVRYFAASDAYMVPSTEEGFPRTLLEAMAAGCPFAATDVGGVPDILRAPQEECMVGVGDTPAMSAVIVRLLGDHTWREELIKVGRAVVQGYSEERVVEQFVSMVSAHE